VAVLVVVAEFRGLSYPFVPQPQMVSAAIITVPSSAIISNLLFFIIFSDIIPPQIKCENTTASVGLHVTIVLFPSPPFFTCCRNLVGAISMLLT
jgi:hypothetical protein